MADSFVHSALCPRIAVLSCPEATAIAKKNGLASFADVLRPFESTSQNGMCHALTQVAIRTSQLEQRMCRVFQVRFDMLEDFMVHGDAPVPIDKLLDMVQICFHGEIEESDTSWPIIPSTDGGPQAWHVRMHASNETFSRFASILYRYRPVSSFDTMSHPCAILFAVSSSSADPLQSFAHLHDDLKKADVFTKQPFMETQVLRCYLIVHDTAVLGTDMSRSMKLLEDVRKTYGLDCAIVHVNSSAQSVPEVSELYESYAGGVMQRVRLGAHDAPAAAHLSTQDVQRLQAYVREMIIKSLVPYLERTVLQLGEQIASQRRGLAGRLLGAGRKWFMPRVSSGSNTQRLDHGVYPASSIPSQTRRLADLAMHVHDYRLAVSMYDAVRRDYQEDHATLYSASAGDMLSLAQILHSLTTRDVSIPVPTVFSSAVDEYVTSRTGEFYALRASVFYAALVGEAKRYEYMALSYIRAAQFTDEIVRALLLEQASIAYLRMPRPHTRRSAAALLQAAAQYKACGQKNLALRCYTHAAEFYKERNTSLYDHSLFQMALLVHNTGRVDDALKYLLPLLHQGGIAALDQMHLQALESVAKYAQQARVTLPTPVFDTAASYILPILSTANGQPCVSIDEEFGVYLEAVNPLGVSITLTDVTLEFCGAQSDGKASDSAVDASARIDTIMLGPYERKGVKCRARVQTDGYTRVASINYTLGGLLHVQQSMQKCGQRLNATPQQRRSKMYTHDTSLLIHVSQSKPIMRIDVDIPADVFVGELVHIPVKVHNAGSHKVDSPIVWTPCNVRVVKQETSLSTLSWEAPGSTEYMLPPLDAGAQYDLTFVWHVSDAGLHTLDWVVKYEAQKNDMFETRVSRFVNAHTVINGTVKVRLAARAEPTYMLAVDIANHGTSVLTCQGISLISPMWTAQLTKMQAVLASGDMCTSFMQLERCSDYPVTLTHTLLALQPLFGRKEKVLPPEDIPVHFSTFGSSNGTLLTRQPCLYAASRHQWHSNYIQRKYSYLPPQFHCSFPLMCSNNVDLLVHWEDANERHGETLLCGICVGIQASTPKDVARLMTMLKSDGATRAIYEETARENAHIKEQLYASPIANIPMPLSMYVPADVVEIDRSPIAKHLTLYIRNEAPWPLTFEVNMMEPSEGTHVTWLGHRRHKGVVPAYASTPIEAHLLFPMPGTYDLGTWACTATLHAEGQIVHTWHLTSSFDMHLTAFRRA